MQKTFTLIFIMTLIISCKDNVSGSGTGTDTNDTFQSPGYEDMLKSSLTRAANTPGSGISARDEDTTDYINGKTDAPDGCGVLTDPSDNTDPTKPTINKTRKGPWDNTWTDTIYETLDEPKYSELMSARLTESELEEIKCPRFHSLNDKDKKKFWAVVIASMVAKEGENNPREFYGEVGTNDSYGLLQIDAPNARAHGCRLKDGSQPKGGKKGRSSGGDMYDPHINIRCGMMILRNQVKKVPYKLFNNKSYWAVLRKNRSTPHNRMKKVLLKHMDQIKTCTVPPGLTGETEVTDANTRQGCVGLADSARLPEDTTIFQSPAPGSVPSSGGSSATTRTIE